MCFSVMFCLFVWVYRRFIHPECPNSPHPRATQGLAGTWQILDLIGRKRDKNTAPVFRSLLFPSPQVFYSWDSWPCQWVRGHDLRHWGDSSEALSYLAYRWQSLRTSSCFPSSCPFLPNWPLSLFLTWSWSHGPERTFPSPPLVHGLLADMLLAESETTNQNFLHKTPS